MKIQEESIYLPYRLFLDYYLRLYTQRQWHKMNPEGGINLARMGDEKQVIYFT